MKQVQEHISVPLKDLQDVLNEAGKCRVLNMRMYSTYKDEWLVDVILFLDEAEAGCHRAEKIAKELGL